MLKKFVIRNFEFKDISNVLIFKAKNSIHSISRRRVGLRNVEGRIALFTFWFEILAFQLTSTIRHLWSDRQNLVLSDVIKIHIEAFRDLLVELIVAQERRAADQDGRWRGAGSDALPGGACSQGLRGRGARRKTLRRIGPPVSLPGAGLSHPGMN